LYQEKSGNPAGCALQCRRKGFFAHFRLLSFDTWTAVRKNRNEMKVRPIRN
jgi:hypothetical protein